MKKVQEKYVSFEVDKLAKEKGFDQRTKYCYDDEGDVSSSLAIDGRFFQCYRPTQSLLRDWIESNSDMVLMEYPYGMYEVCSNLVYPDGTFGWVIYNSGKYADDNSGFQTRHEALEDCLLNALNRMPDEV